MTRYARSRLHDEVATYLAFWAIVGPRESVPETPDPWTYLRRAIAVLRGE
jgi:hypothetical protein